MSSIEIEHVLNISSLLNANHDKSPQSDFSHTLLLPFQIAHLDLDAGNKKFDLETKCDAIVYVLTEEFKKYPFMMILHGINSWVANYFQSKYNSKHFPFKTASDELLNVCILYHIDLASSNILADVNLVDVSFKILGLPMRVMLPCETDSDCDTDSDFEIFKIYFNWLAEGRRQDKQLGLEMYDYDSVLIGNFCPHVECRKRERETQKEVQDAYKTPLPSDYHPYKKLLEFIGFSLVIEMTDEDVSHIKLNEELYQILREKNLLKKKFVHQLL